MQHGCVVGLIERAKSRRKRAEALVAIDLQIENMNDKGVAGLGAFDEEWPG